MTVQEMIKECINKTQIKAITEQMKISMRAWLECAVDFGKDIDELSEENEKLKERIAELQEEMNAKQVVLNDFKSRVETVTGRFNKKSSQLTKAKEIIEKFLDAKNIEDTCVAESEAEHFLQELSGLQTVSIDRSEI